MIDQIAMKVAQKHALILWRNAACTNRNERHEKQCVFEHKLRRISILNKTVFTSLQLFLCWI